MFIEVQQFCLSFVLLITQCLQYQPLTVWPTIGCRHSRLPAYIRKLPPHVRNRPHHHPHVLLHTSPRPTVTKHVFCHLQTQIRSAKRPRPHTHTKDPSTEELRVRSTSQAGKTSGKGFRGGKLLLNELIRH